MDSKTIPKHRKYRTTNGTISPREALEQSISLMINQLKAIVGFEEEEEEKDEELKIEEQVQKSEEIEVPDEDVLKIRVEELNLSGRTLNALIAAGIRTVGGLVKKSVDDLLSLDGVGNKTIDDIKNALDRLTLNLKE